MTKAIVITTEKEVREQDVSGLDSMQAIVGGLIEPVTLSDGSTLYVNEEGIPLGLPFNSIASDVCGLGGATHMLFQGVQGDVFIVGPLDEEGNDTDVTDLARRWVRRVEREA